MPGRARVTPGGLADHVVNRAVAGQSEKRTIAVMDDILKNQARGPCSVLPEDGRLVRMSTEAVEAERFV